MARPGRGVVHRAAGSDDPGASPRASQLEAVSRRLNAEVEQLRAENARLSVRDPHPAAPHLARLCLVAHCLLSTMYAHLLHASALPGVASYMWGANTCRLATARSARHRPAWHHDCNVCRPCCLVTFTAAQPCSNAGAATAWVPTYIGAACGPMQAANAARTADQTAARAAEALNASLMAENAELRRHTAGLQEARAAGGGMVAGGSKDSADDAQRYTSCT
jgi:hypothetical protein